MLEVATSVTTLYFAITLDFNPYDGLYDETFGLQSQPGSQAISFHPSLVPDRQQYIEVFRRLKALHAPLEALRIDIKARAGGKPSAEVYRVLEVHIKERETDIAADPHPTTCPAGQEKRSPCGYRHVDFSAQAVTALVKDLTEYEHSEDGSDAMESEDAKSALEEDKSPAVESNAVVRNLPVESAEIDQQGKLNQLRLWREACWFTDFFRPVTSDS
jgi:hypothetical protein